MNLWIVVLLIAIISIALAINSLKDFDNKHVKHVKKTLLSGRTVFHSSNEELQVSSVEGRSSSENS